MADNTNQPDSDRQLEERLRSYRERIAFPQMADSAAAARARIEATGNARPPAATRAAAPFDELNDDHVHESTTGSIIDFPAERTPGVLRQVLTLAAAALAILIVGGALLVVIPGLSSDRDNVGVLGPETREYRASGVIGGPLVPNEPVSVALDDDGNIYAADIATRNVHKFDPDGQYLASWTAGDAEIGAFMRPWDIAIRDGTVYVLDQQRSAVFLLSTDGEVQDAWHIGDPEDTALLMTGIAVNTQGMVYVTRANEGAIGVYQPDGTHVRDVVVSADLQSGDDRPIDVAVADDGTLYVTSFSGTSLRVFDPGGAMVADWTGIELQSRHSGGLFGVTVAPSGDVYVNSESAVARISTDGTTLATWTIAVGEPMAALLPPGSVAVGAQGAVFMADQWGHRIVALTNEGESYLKIRDERQNRFALPGGLHVGNAGALFVADAGRKQVMEFSNDGDFVRTTPWAVDTAGPPVNGQIGAVTTFEDHIYVLDGPNSAIVRLTRDGKKVLEWSGALIEPDTWIRPTGLDADSQGTIYLLDTDAGAIYRYNPDGEYLGNLITEGYEQPLAMSIVEDSVYVAFAGGEEPGVWTLDLKGNPIERVVAFERNADGKLAISPGAIAIAGTGDIFLLDSFRREVHWYGADGTLRSSWSIGAGSDESFTFMDIAVDDSGTLFVSNTDSRQILVYEPVE